MKTGCFQSVDDASPEGRLLCELSMRTLRTVYGCCSAEKTSEGGRIENAFEWLEARGLWASCGGGIGGQKRRGGRDHADRGKGKGKGKGKITDVSNATAWSEQPVHPSGALRLSVVTHPTPDRMLTHSHGYMVLASERLFDEEGHKMNGRKMGPDYAQSQAAAAGPGDEESPAGGSAQPIVRSSAARQVV